MSPRVPLPVIRAFQRTPASGPAAGPLVLRAAPRWARPTMPTIGGGPLPPDPGTGTKGATGASVDDWRLAVADGLPLPDTKLTWTVEVSRAVVLGHRGRCAVRSDVAADSLATLLGRGSHVPGPYELNLCPTCRPPALAWYLRASALPVRAHAVTEDLRTRALSPAQEWALLPGVVAALGSRDAPSQQVRAAAAERADPPAQAAEPFVAAVTGWARASLEETYQRLEQARGRRFADPWLAKTLKLAGLDPDLDGDLGPDSGHDWLFVDHPGALARFQHRDGKLLAAALMHPVRFPARAVTADGRWWAVRWPHAWVQAIPAGSVTAQAGPAHSTDAAPLLMEAALRLWRDAVTGVAEPAFTDPVAALERTRHLLG